MTACESEKTTDGQSLSMQHSINCSSAWHSVDDQRMVAQSAHKASLTAVDADGAVAAIEQAARALDQRLP